MLVPESSRSIRRIGHHVRDILPTSGLRPITILITCCEKLTEIGILSIETEGQVREPDGQIRESDLRFREPDGQIRESDLHFRETEGQIRSNLTFQWKNNSSKK